MHDPNAVLIVGAGPTGLTLACALAQRGVAFRIIDKKPEPTQTSNALAIQPHTLQLLDEMGLVDRFLQAGIKAEKLQLYVDGRDFVNVTLANVDPFYPFMLLLPQSETENILADHLHTLGAQIARATELVDIQQTADALSVQIRHADARLETWTPRWIIAADGAHSTVREKLHIPFEGDEFPQQFLLADVKLSHQSPQNQINVFFNQDTLLGIVPIGVDRFRVIGTQNKDHTQALTDKEIQRIIDERTHHRFQWIQSFWCSHFWIHSKLVRQLRQGSIFLAGDAAHIHSPAGGQGMNTGMQDAYNLAWKLALVIQGKAPSSLLDSYHTERYPINQHIVKQTERFTQLMLTRHARFIPLRNKILQWLLRCSWCVKKIATQISQLSTHYPRSPIIHYFSTVSSRSPQPGEHYSDVVIHTQSRLLEFLRGTQHHVLLFTGWTPTPHELQTIQAMSKKIVDTFGDLVSVRAVVYKKLPDKSWNESILDEEGTIHQRYHIRFPAIYAIRPDYYIAFCSHRLDYSGLERCLQSYLSPFLTRK